MYSSACIRPREDVQHRSAYGLRGVEPCIPPPVFGPREEVQHRSGHVLKGIESCIRPLVFVRVKKCKTEVELLVVILRTKFEVSSCSCYRHIEVVPKFKSRSRDLSHAPFVP